MLATRIKTLTSIGILIVLECGLGKKDGKVEAFIREVRLLKGTDSFASNSVDFYFGGSQQRSGLSRAI